MQEEKTVSVGNVQYKVAQFSAGIQQAVEIYNIIQLDLQKAQTEVVKNQAALQSIGAQITEGIKQELAAAEKEESSELDEDTPKPPAPKKVAAKKTKAK